MRLLINTDGIQFRVASPAKPKPDYKDKERQATTRDGEPIWTVRLDAIEPEREARETFGSMRLPSVAGARRGLMLVRSLSVRSGR
jgi:hypothetical protein